ncbi:FluC/FEX family fluoride channel [Ruania zhangjianzhongii]|uniref:FluC/FEX family fluoride channel n=1 Tax=Ruania zhangjianzhongii TaxID=2603206 RepID=UPI0011CCAE05|nr:CrcB family protein [Ruania zhangjianzhongii]
MTRSALPRPAVLGLILAGGAVGTTGRYLLETAFAPPAGHWPWVTFVINVTGAFLLGGLLFGLGRSGEDTGARRGLRLGAGTGLLGGFTTYSTFTLEVHGLFGGGQLWTGLGYAAGSVLTGVAAAAGGALLARWLVPVQRPEAGR